MVLTFNRHRKEKTLFSNHRKQKWLKGLNSNAISEAESMLLRSQINFPRGLSSFFARLSGCNGVLEWLGEVSNAFCSSSQFTRRPTNLFSLGLLRAVKTQHFCDVACREKLDIPKAARVGQRWYSIDVKSIITK